MTVSYISTTHAAFLLNISTGRLRLLLNTGRVVDAKKVGRFWRIPLNHRGMPEITPGRRGPQGTWNKFERTAKTIVHVLRKTIDYNRDDGTSYPAVALTSSPAVRRGDSYRVLALRWVDVSLAAATLAVVLHLPPRPFNVSDCPPATNIFIAAFSSRSCFAPQFRHSHSRT